MDDGSTDSTKKEVLSVANKSNKVRFYDRKKEGHKKGLANSMIDGLSLTKTKYAIFMDGDMQHPTETIKKIYLRLRKGDKIVIATREKIYNTIAYRQAISYVFSALGIMALKMQGSATSNDIFSGYFGLESNFARKKIEENRKRFIGEGYKFLFDLLKSTRMNEVPISEIDYRFKTRTHGSSKASIKQGTALILSFIT